MGLMVTTLKYNGQKYYCANCRMIQHQLTPYCKFCGNEFANYEEIISESNPPEIIVGGRWWEEPEEELTDRQKELLDKLYVAVKELRESIFEEE